jgi:KDO2-lipid IV(A) lauroyltransferase
LSELFLRHREELGMRIIPLSKDGHVGQQLKQLLADNWIVALVADRDLGGRGVEVEMFGERRRVPAGPALLSLTTDAPLCVCPVQTLSDGWSVTIGDPIEFERTGETKRDVVELTRRMAAEFERAIAANPPDWHLFQPGWEPQRDTVPVT